MPGLTDTQISDAPVCQDTPGRANPVGHQETSTGHMNGAGHDHTHVGYANGEGHQMFHGECVDERVELMELVCCLPPLNEDMPAEYSDELDEVQIDIFA